MERMLNESEKSELLFLKQWSKQNELFCYNEENEDQDNSYRERVTIQLKRAA